MPLIHRTVEPKKLSATKLKLEKNDSEFVAVNNGTLVNVLRQLASLVGHANEIFAEFAILTDAVGKRVRSVKLKLDELEVKAELYDPKLVPVPEGNLDTVSAIPHRIQPVTLQSDLFSKNTRPHFLQKLYIKAGSHQPNIPLRSPVTDKGFFQRHNGSNHNENRRPASFAALREWKLDDYVDSKIAVLTTRVRCSADDVGRTVSSTFPSQLVQVDVTGKGFDRMKANRRSLMIHTKKIRIKKRRNTICGMPNKECGIQTSFSSVASPSDNKKYGIDSGHWSSCTSSAQGVTGAASSSSAPSPWDPTSLSTSSDFLFDDEDRSLTPQLENFTDGMISDSDSVDTEGYFTSFRNECGFPKSRKITPDDSKDEKSVTTGSASNLESEYELFGKGSTSTTASSCGTVVMRNKPEPPARSLSIENFFDKKPQPPEDSGWEERVKRKSLIERVPSLVVVTPSPSCSSGSPPPCKDPISTTDQEDSDSGRITPKAADFSNESGSCTLSDCSDSEKDVLTLTDPVRSSSRTSTGSSSDHSTHTLTRSTTNLPQPDVIPDVQVIRGTGSKLDAKREYYALDTVLLGSPEEEHQAAELESKKDLSPAVSSKVRGARVVLDSNGQIIFASETLKRKRKHKVSFDPGEAVKQPDYDSASNYARLRESVYDKLRKEPTEEIYERIEEIRRHNLEASEQSYKEKANMGVVSPTSPSPPSSTENTVSPVSSPEPQAFIKLVKERGTKVNGNNTLLETDLDSAIPPVMSELRNLPKIKDRLKRNESYRIATDEIPPRPTSLLSNKRPPFLTNGNHQKLLPKNINVQNGHSNNNINRKRDIPEENPAYVQQILSMNSATHSPSGKTSPADALNRAAMSKFSLTSEDRPSFLRRESPPTMDDIAKEIYRFRKKFNIQPPLNQRSSSTPTTPIKRDPAIERSLVLGSQPSLIRSPLVSPVQSPLTNGYGASSMPLTSTPLKRAESTYDRLRPASCQAIANNENGLPKTRYLPSPSGHPAFPSLSSRSSDTISSSPTSSYNRMFSSRSSLRIPSSQNTLPSSPVKQISGSDSRIPQFHRATYSSLRLKSSATTLGDFKKLLESSRTTQQKRSSVSAIEALKPKQVETTI